MNDDTGEHPITREQAEAWMNWYKRAWEDRDVALAISLFTSDVDYRENRFGDPLRGFKSLEQYWRARVAEYQRDVHFQFQVWAVSGSECYAGFQAHFIWLPMNGIMELDGACRLRFVRRDDGQLLCSKFEEWLARRDN